MHASKTMSRNSSTVCKKENKKEEISNLQDH